MNTAQINELQKIHVAAWNEKDRTKRYELLQQIYAEDIKMYDRDFILNGLKEVSDFIGKLLAEDEAFNFAAAKPIEPLQNSARFFGHINTSKGLLNSMDFFILENGKAKHLYAFMEPAG
ncbi:hypothetical protein [Ferruginibacter sp. HRS2-29]|uniref:hypothetical protein n=1 Tax=Ferruginibacter sp. HRS2-29 TaxID=2487334 RepID=UPI0020CDB27B|nr:hypothetical protein [Ferruginibacter sp. HRS2-29]MCP9750086.1 nuclear transport factor 2 family protein [Ferruginibacter sp. HRS2-29]